MARITTGILKDLESKVAKGEISYSRMVEILNEHAKLNESSAYEFCKIRLDKMPHRGERYFRFKWNCNKVIQVCLEVGNETKKGKGHLVGIYEIARVTLFSNWYPNYIESCTEDEFNNAFERAINLLKVNHEKL